MKYKYQDSLDTLWEIYYNRNTRMTYPWKFCNALKNITECVQKQIPKKPKIEYCENRIKSEQIVYICPVCGDDFNDNEYELDYCWNCGQAIDWSEGE